jgi:hypothetical protein
MVTRYIFSISLMALLTACAVAVPAPSVQVVDTAVAIQAAGQLCGVRDTMIRKLEGEYEEQQVMVGLLDSGLTLETFASTRGGWTMIVTSSGGMSCLFASGTSYHPFKRGLPMPLPPKEAPSPPQLKM